MRTGLALVSALALSLVACSSGSGGGKGPQLTPGKTFCQPMSEPNVYLRVDFSSPTARVSLVRLMQSGEAPIEYALPKSMDTAWKQVPDASKVTIKENDNTIYVNFAAADQIPEDMRQEVNERTITNQKWVGTGISHPKPSAAVYATIAFGGADNHYMQDSTDYAACSAFDDGLLKPSASLHDNNEYALYDWQVFASRTPEGTALETAVEPKLPMTTIALNSQELYEKSWCTYQFNANPERDGGLGVTVYTFLGNRLVWSFFRDGEEPSATGFRMATRFTKNSVQTNELDEKDDQYKYHPEYFRQKDASGRDYLNEGSPGIGPDALPLIIPCNDEKVFALHPSWRDWVAKIREIQLSALREPNDGKINIGAILPYVDENGVPQLKVIPKDPSQPAY